MCGWELALDKEKTPGVNWGSWEGLLGSTINQEIFIQYFFCICNFHG